LTATEYLRLKTLYQKKLRSHRHLRRRRLLGRCVRGSLL
jgi:hypothetical protein